MTWSASEPRRRCLTRHLPRGVRHQRGKFLKGPIPWDWLTKAVDLPGKVLALSLVLWREVGCQKSYTVRLSPSAVKAFGVSRTTAYVALTRLEHAGLVSVERHRGRAPRVTILDSDKQP